MPYEEKPASKRARVGWLIVSWILFIGPFTVLFFAWGGLWWGIVALALAVWLTYDYLKRGGFFEQIDSKDVTIGDKEWRIRRLF